MIRILNAVMRRYGAAIERRHPQPSTVEATYCGWCWTPRRAGDVNCSHCGRSHARI